MTFNTETTSNGKIAYNFTANATDYTVIDDQNGLFTVISHRRSLQFPTLNVHTRDELIKRSKTMRSLVALIEAEGVAA